MRENDITQLRFLRLTANLPNKFDPTIAKFCGVNIVGAKVGGWVELQMYHFT